MPSSYRDLDVWKRSKALVLRTYQLTGGFPRREVFGIAAQMRSAALSVPANIAEGQGRMGGDGVHPLPPHLPEQPGRA